MEIRSVSVGVVAIKSVSTGLYLAMSKKGTLFGSVGASSIILQDILQEEQSDLIRTNKIFTVERW